MNNNIVIRCENLVKQYPSGEGYLTVLKGISLDVKQGEILAILGPSGAGKSTLLHIIGLLDKPTSGMVYFKDTDITKLTLSEQARIRNLTFGFVFQFYHLIPELDVLENTLLPYMINHSLTAWAVHRRGLYQRAKDLLARLGLAKRIRHRVGVLSGGEKQRAAIARALITNPEIVFCDEPTGNLDSVTSQEIQNLIWKLNEDAGTTFVIVTHEAAIARRAHRLLRLVDGIIQTDSLRPGGHLCPT